MEFTREEERILLQALYRFRGDVSGASQSEQNRYAMVEKVIGKIEREAGPLSPERTKFDREMEESLSVLARGGAWPPEAGELDGGQEAPKAKPKSRSAPAAKGKAKAKEKAKPRTETKTKAKATAKVAAETKRKAAKR